MFGVQCILYSIYVCTVSIQYRLQLQTMNVCALKNNFNISSAPGHQSIYHYQQIVHRTAQHSTAQCSKTEGKNNLHSTYIAVLGIALKNKHVQLWSVRSMRKNFLEKYRYKLNSQDENLSPEASSSHTDLSCESQNTKISS